jgi:predicted DNA-binding transcriptional regulator AlpA
VNNLHFQIEVVDTKQIHEMLGKTVSVKTIRDRWTKDPAFPQPVRLPVRTRAKHWRRKDVEEFIVKMGSPELVG